MGTKAVKPFLSGTDRKEYFKHLLRDIAALEQLQTQGKIAKTNMHIGAEQEFCLVDSNWEPSTKAPEILKAIDNMQFTTELTRYNLEANLDPLPLKGNSFSQMHASLNALLDHAQQHAKDFENHIILAGILPTIGTRHLSRDFMSPVKRYEVLDKAVTELRGEDVELHIKGVDEVNLHHDSIMYEGCNTSFQAHLQIDPDDFQDTYNWAQAISGPILSIAVNSPLLMGKELWAESRIALFTQSVDTRRSTFLLNEREPRVGFGSDWAKGTPADFFRQTVQRFRSIITTDFDSTDSLEQLENGTLPDLKALNLFNGTVYPWNRLCYGKTKHQAHLRIENRYLPSGPTTTDEIANMMFWVGVMKGRGETYKKIDQKMAFKDAKKNFFNAARYGMAAQFYWDGELIPSQNLLLDVFLPMAYRGLYSQGIDPADAEKYLGVIERRIKTHTGAAWQVSAYRKLLEYHKPQAAVQALTQGIYSRSEKGYTIDAWSAPRSSEFHPKPECVQVRHRMNTQIITVQNNDSTALTLALMQWNQIHHLPVLNQKNEIYGLIHWDAVAAYLDTPQVHEMELEQLINRNVTLIGPEQSWESCPGLMETHQTDCLLVQNGSHLVGIVTRRDFI